MTGATRVRLDVVYDGTEFSGWAAQPGLRTCQQLLEDALSTAAQAPVAVTVAGRTDAGVHALGQVAHADVPEELANDPRLAVRLTRLMRASDIAVVAAAPAPAAFDARFSATFRRYRYLLQLGAPNPLRRDVAFWPRALDVAPMQEFADALLGLRDFAAFCKPREGATTVRELRDFSWAEVPSDGPGVLLGATLIADAFCHSMVRSLVGASVAVGEGQLSVREALALAEARERTPRIPLMPPSGLTLMEVGYPEDAEGRAAQSERARAKRAPLPVAVPQPGQ